MKRREGGLARRAGGADAGEPDPTASSSERTDRSAAERSTITDRRELAWPDTRLVRECRNGNEEAWAALLDKYKNLIFSIPIKRGLPREEAADVFQRVCVLHHHPSRGPPPVRTGSSPASSA